MQKESEINELKAKIDYLDSVASELQDTCDKQAKTLGQIRETLQRALSLYNETSILSSKYIDQLKFLTGIEQTK
jgi:ABC-type transporter Mla subunit MlaD